MFQPGLFAHEVILVTGGGTAIGRCIACEVAALGGLPILAGRRAEVLDRTVKEIWAADG
ncbi:hypothetical protein [Streptomyces sp. NPDC001978]|uniref:hypothetical protein n=1 Tax=Streptomyces sp. NPDC001978 TaxID=3364627 RepID=UPI00367C0F72